MSDIGLIVSGMNELSRRYDVTVTVARDGSYLRDPAEFAVAAEQAAMGRNATIVSAHTAEQIISVVAVEARGPSPSPGGRVRSAKPSGRIT